MDTIVIARETDDIPRVVALDTPDDCHLCSRTDAATAGRTLAGLCRWWIDGPTREGWAGQTFIDGRRRPDRAASDAWFQLAVPSRPNPLPIFLIISQHWDGKQHPHYQLQVPSANLVKGVRGSAPGAAVEQLAGVADHRVQRLRAGERRSISLHAPLLPSDLDVVQEAISALVAGVCALDWAGRA
jgi:hypothetical protein